MDKALTLQIDSDVIEKSKRYAEKNATTLNVIIKSYLQLLATEKTATFEISPFVKSMTTKTDMPSDYNYKKDYYDYLDRKYK